jgi:[ribosomal protein S18]-alanine N-acetyltransferase
MMEISEGNGHDIAAIMPIMQSAFDPDFNEAWTAAQCLSSLALPGTQLLLARGGEGVTGFTLSRWVTDEEELLLIAVDRNGQRQNTGRQLIKALIANAIDAGRSSIFLEVRDGNPAFAFYRQMGFEPFGRRREYYRAKDGSKHDSITMVMKL